MKILFNCSGRCLGVIALATLGNLAFGAEMHGSRRFKKAEGRFITVNIADQQAALCVEEAQRSADLIIQEAQRKAALLVEAAKAKVKPITHQVPTAILEKDMCTLCDEICDLNADDHIKAWNSCSGGLKLHVSHLACSKYYRSSDPIMNRINQITFYPEDITCPGCNNTQESLEVLRKEIAHKKQQERDEALKQRVLEEAARPREEAR